MSKNNFKHLSLTKRFMIAVYLMDKKLSAVFISLVSFFFLGGIALILTGVYFNNNIDKAFTNIYSIIGITILCLTLVTVTLSALTSNYGGRLFRKEIEAIEAEKNKDNKEAVQETEQNSQNSSDNN